MPEVVSTMLPAVVTGIATSAANVTGNAIWDELRQSLADSGIDSRIADELVRLLRSKSRQINIETLIKICENEDSLRQYVYQEDFQRIVEGILVEFDSAELESESIEEKELSFADGIGLGLLIASTLLLFVIALVIFLTL